MPLSAPFYLIGRNGPGADKAQRPPLELVTVQCGKSGRARVVGRLAFHFIRLLDFLAEGVLQAALDERDGKVSDVDADPGRLRR